MSEQKPRIGDLRIWWKHPHSDGQFTVTVTNLKEAKKILEVLNEYDRFCLLDDERGYGGVNVVAPDVFTHENYWTEWRDRTTGLGFEEFCGKYPEEIK